MNQTSMRMVLKVSKVQYKVITNQIKLNQILIMKQMIHKINVATIMSIHQIKIWWLEANSATII